MPPASQPPTGATRMPPRPAKALPAVPNGAAGINALGGASANMARQFLAGAHAFMLSKSVETQPQANTGVITSSTIAAGDKFRSHNSIDDPYDVKIDLKREGPLIRYIRFDAQSLQGGKARLMLFDQPGPGLLPIYWLPWQPKAVLQTTIPAIPAGANVNDNDTYPKFFFTASLSGCSIFVKGPHGSPTIYHAGLDVEKIKGSSGKFWKEQMQALNTGFDAAQLKGLVHKKSYIEGEEREAVQAYKRWLESDRTGTFKVEYVQGSGLVFGVRNGRDWTFYLQESASMNIIRFVKGKETVPSKIYANVLTHQDSAGTSHGITVTPTNEKRKVGPLTLPKAFDKKGKLYSYSAETVASPVRVVEIYPASYKAATSSTLSYSVI